MQTGPGRSRAGLVLAGAVLGAAVLGGCGAAPVPVVAEPTGSASAPAPALTSAARAPEPIRTAGIPTSQRRTFIPTSLRMPSGSLVAVDPAGVDAKGVLEVPDDITRGGWWTGGARAGDPFGGIVIAGHVDSLEKGIGTMAQLIDAAPGQEVRLDGAGEQRLYRITSRRQVSKARLSADLAVFDQLTPERLVLITCGGEFDPVARHYADNIVVIATPVERP